MEFFDIFVSINNGPFTPWLQKTALTGALYPGKQSDHYAFYSVATDHVGNQEAAHATPDAQTTVSLLNTAPKISAPAKMSVNEGAKLTFLVTASDPDLPVRNRTSRRFNNRRRH